jgi:HEAT repeat protein
MHKARLAVASFVCAATLGLLVPVTRARARAQGAHPSSKSAASLPAGPAFTMTPAVAQALRSGDDAQVRAALDDVRMAGKGAQAAAPILAELLQRGLSTSLTEAALDTLGDVEAESASVAIAWYAAHRNVTLRRAAVRALARTKGPAAAKALRGALHDSDAAVRGVAATGLGALKAKDAVGELFVAFDHGVPEGAAAIGQLCAPAECRAFAGRLERAPFDVMSSGFEQILFRPAAEISDDEKVTVIGKIRELGTLEANKFLLDVQKRWPASWSSRVKQALEQAVLATAGGAQ